MKNFFVVEGGDCCGKSMFVKLLIERLNALGKDVFTMHPYHDHPEGVKAYEAMSAREPIEHVRWLSATAHDIATNEYVAPKLEEGYVVVQDRNWLSTINYQWVNHGANPLEDKELLRCVHESYADYKPFVILLDGPDHIIDSRLLAKEGKDANELESLQFHKKLRKQYRDLMGTWISWGYEGMMVDSSSMRSVQGVIDVLLPLKEKAHGVVSI